MTAFTGQAISPVTLGLRPHPQCTVRDRLHSSPHHRPHGEGKDIECLGNRMDVLLLF